MDNCSQKPCAAYYFTCIFILQSWIVIFAKVEEIKDGIKTIVVKNSSNAKPLVI